MKPLSFVLSIAGMAVASVAAASNWSAPFDSNLTPWGAEIAGNADGSIPPYSGGVANPPEFDYSTGALPDPYPDDEVLFWISAENMAEYADKLSPGTQEMMKKYPTFRIAVYPTRRSVSYDEGFIRNTLENVSRCSIKEDGLTLDVSKGCRGGYPFPKPTNGVEVMWNQKAGYMGPARLRLYDAFYIKPSGEIVLGNRQYGYEDNGLYDPDKKIPTRQWGIRTEYLGPARVAGQATLIFDDFDGTRRSWSYQPSTRRTRLAPDLAGDTPIAVMGGVQIYDQINMFSGAMDRWNWELVGKQEMYIPYNVYGLNTTSREECKPHTGLLKPYHANPECVRWELHRVWHVRATLKEGKRHVLQRRDFFFDEDTWFGGLQDTYDKNGNLWHVLWAPIRPDYVKHVPLANVDHPTFDLNSGTYTFPMGWQAWVLDKPLPASALNSDSLSSFVLSPPGK